nr:uncharacterized protein LOC108076367 [Drosophila kikkawai]
MTRIFVSKILSSRHLKSLFSNYSLSKIKNPFMFTYITFLRSSKDPKASDIKTNWRQFSDKLSQKGRGDELNYFLRIRREQFIKLNERKIKEIVADLRVLEAKLSKIGSKTTAQQEKAKQKLIMEIKELKAALENYKKTLKEDKTK